MLASPGGRVGTRRLGPRPGVEVGPVGPETPATLSVELPEAGAVVAHITDEQGKPIPCKAQFIGRDGTSSPDFGPDSGEVAVKNVYYSHNGRFRRELGPARMT